MPDEFVIEHYDFDGQVVLTSKDGVEHITRQPVYDRPLLVAWHYEGDPCVICDGIASADT